MKKTLFVKCHKFIILLSHEKKKQNAITINSYKIKKKCFLQIIFISIFKKIFFQNVLTFVFKVKIFLGLDHRIYLLRIVSHNEKNNNITLIEYTYCI